MDASFLQAPAAKRLESKVALITGGASGIGAAAARLFVRHGAKVVVADIQDDLGHALVNDTRMGSGSEEVISYLHCNVSAESDVREAVDTTVAKHGKLDIMFSNAGIVGKPTPSIQDTDEETMRRVLDVNLFGAFFCAKHASRVMVPAKKGTIIFTTSVVAVCFGDVPYSYAASKSAVLGLSKNLGVELGEHGIRVNCISPYALSTPMGLDTLGIPDKQKADQIFSTPANLKGTVLDENDCAEAALYLASDDSKYVSGHNLVIDGGFSTTNRAFGQAIRNAFSST